LARTGGGELHALLKKGQGFICHSVTKLWGKRWDGPNHKAVGRGGEETTKEILQTKKNRLEGETRGGSRHLQHCCAHIFKRKTKLTKGGEKEEVSISLARSGKERATGSWVGRTICENR